MSSSRLVAKLDERHLAQAAVDPPDPELNRHRNLHRRATSAARPVVVPAAEVLTMRNGQSL